MTRLSMPFAIAISLLGIGAAPSWAGPDLKSVTCAKGPWAFEDPATLKADSGVQSLGKVETPLGTWEARARFSKGEVSELQYLRNGKPAPEVPASKLPLPLRDCLTQRQAAAPVPTLGTTAWSVLESMIPAAQARQTCRPVILSASCYGVEHGTCCALAACGSARAFRCVDF